MENEKIKIQKIVDLLRESKDSETFYDLLYNLYVLLNIAKGVEEINQENGIPLNEFLSEREELYENYNRKFG